MHCTAWGEGDEAVLRYLARYVFRVAITSSRIVGLDENGVTFRHKHRASNRWRTTRLSGHEFMRRFSCSTCYRKDCTRSATTACGIGAGASTLNEPVSCSCSRPSTNTVSSHTIRRDGRPRH